MHRGLIITAVALAAVGLAAAPAVAGLAGNPSFSHQLPVHVPSQARVAQLVDDHGRDNATPPKSAEPEPGDDRGGVTSGEPEPGDDRGGVTSGEPEPGDDRGGVTSGEPEPGDDRGGATSGEPEPGDDHGGDSSSSGGGPHSGSDG